MSERRDDTTERDKQSRAERDRQHGSYYYDDSTGYEIYEPTKDNEGDEDEAENENDEGAVEK